VVLRGEYRIIIIVIIIIIIFTLPNVVRFRNAVKLSQVAQYTFVIISHTNYVLSP